MKHIKIIKREDGTHIQIEVSLSIESFRDEFKYHVSISKKFKNKRKWIHHPLKWDSEANLLCSQAEIKVAKFEFWEKIKPV